MNSKLPSYDALFGIDFKEGEAARSVYSPAAYLADLLQLIDDHFATADLDIRRSDLKEILLDGEHTFSEIPYLDVVTEVLENKVLGSPYVTLKEAKYPFNLPFNLHEERTQLYLDRFEVKGEEVYQLFAVHPESGAIARLSLGLAPEMESVLVPDHEPTEPEIAGFYYHQTTAALSNVSTFLKTTGITGLELRELLFQNLSHREQEAQQSLSPQEQQDQASVSRTAFIHDGLNGYVSLDLSDEQERLQWQGQDDAIPSVWFSRVNRLLRLSRETALSLSDLDLILRSCCQNLLDRQALQYISVIKKIATTYDLAIAVVCSFFSDINIDGHSNEDRPIDLFNQIFNEPLIDIDQQYLQPLEDEDYLPQQYQSYTSLQRLNFLSVEQELFSSKPAALAARNRLQQSLRISSADLQRLVSTLEVKLGDEFLQGLTLLNKLSLYYRICQLAESLDVSIQEFFTLCDLLEQDSTIRQTTHFNFLIHCSCEEFSCYKILANGPISASMWLVQTLYALLYWMQKNQFSIDELQSILAGSPQADLADTETELQTISGLDNLYQQFKPFLFHSEHLVADPINERLARVVHNTLIEDEWHLVSAQDHRLLKTHLNQVEPAIYQALSRLPIITPADFEALDIQEKLQEKIFANLILHGYLQTDGMLIEGGLPPSADELVISSTFDSVAIFDLIADLYRSLSEAADSTDPAEGFSLFLADLSPLKLCHSDADLHHEAQKREELYQNLIYNGYINADGEVLDPLLFAHAENRESFTANIELSKDADILYGVIAAKTQAFVETEFKVSVDLFGDLPLAPIEVADLIENLQFNDYIDEHQVVIDKAHLLELNVADFAIALAYYPYRHQILGSIQQALGELKAKFYIFSPEDFSTVSRQIVADQIYTYLDEHYLENGVLVDAAVSFFTAEDNAPELNLGHYFDENARIIVFKAIHQIVQTFQSYRVDLNDFAELGLAEEEVWELIGQLSEKDYVNADGSLSTEQVKYFLNIHNALDIALAEFEDFAKDIFFILHALAKNVDATVQTLVSSYLALAEQQEAALLAGLQELFETPAETVQVMCRYVLGPNESLSEQFILPLLQDVDESDRITQIPKNYRFIVAFNRIQQFAKFANKLGLDAVETDIVFRDQNLAEKFSEKLQLPAGVDHIEGLVSLNINRADLPELETTGVLRVILLYTTVDAEPQYWLYRADNYQLLTETAISLAQIAAALADISRIDASFNDAMGTAWLISGTDFFCQPKDSLTWEHKTKELGVVDSNFEELDRIDAAFIDRDRKLYLFSGDQYLRSSDGLPAIDEGYPQSIASNWSQEHGLSLPPTFSEAVDAAFIGANENLYFFKGQKFISSADFDQALDINAVWGKVKNHFTQGSKIDAALALSDRIYFFVDDQVMSWSASLECEDGLADEGSIQSLTQLIPDLSDEFRDGIDAAFKGVDDRVHLFKDGHHVSMQWRTQPDGSAMIFDLRVADAPLNEQWGHVRNPITQTNSPISAAFSGLDGKAYLFCGDQYYRYSGNSYTYVDEGYPKRIADHWGGLDTVDAAFILDGKTYLVGRDGDGEPVYVRYSTHDYAEADQDYPRSMAGNWWEDHFNLQDVNTAGGAANDRTFASPDAVFIGPDGVTYLLKGTEYIAYDKLRRWWTEPQPIATKWAGLPDPFSGVEAAFTGKDGRTYLFLKAPAAGGGTPEYQYLRYTDKHFNRLDDRFPKPIKEFWGRVKNNLHDTNRIDAAVVLEWAEPSEVGGEVGPTRRYTYLFSGDQFYRYTAPPAAAVEPYGYVDEGYPRAIAALAHEPRCQNLPYPLERIDAAFGDRRNVYLFTGDRCLVVADQAYREYAALLPSVPQAVVQAQGAIYVEDATTGWQTLKNLEGGGAIAPIDQPPLLRELPTEFSHDIDAAFVGTDASLYVFKGSQCYNNTLEEAYPIHEEWWQERNNVVLNNHVDAALVGVDGKLYLFSGDQFLTYTPAANTQTWPELADDHPQAIRDHWGGLENVHIAFVREGKTYLLEAPDDYGNFRYVCYTSETYAQPDGEPQTGDLHWWNFPSIYLEEGFDRVDTVLVDDEQMFLFKGSEFIHYNQEDDLWTYPRPVNRIWREFPFDEAVAIATVFKDHQGVTHFFSEDQVTAEQARGFSAPVAIRQQWGHTHNHILHNQHRLREANGDAPIHTIDAAVVINHAVTYLFSGDQYVRYSTSDYRFVDAGYPKLIVGNLRQEEGFTHLPKSFDERLEAAIAATGHSGLQGITTNGRNLYIFEQGHCHVVSQQLTGEVPISRLGQLKNNLRVTGQVDAAFIRPDDAGLVEEPQTFLFSGDQYVRYTGVDYDTVDDGYPKAIAQLITAEGLGADSPEFRAAAVQGIDAALWHPTGTLWLFQGAQVWQLGAEEFATTALASVIPTGANPFVDGVDTAFASAEGQTYFFKGDRYIRYSDLAQAFVDEGYPKSIQDHWGNLPAAFEAGIDHAFGFEGRTYFIKQMSEAVGDEASVSYEYVRYSDPSYQLIDPIYPQKFMYRWGDWHDYLLSDIYIITEFKQLMERSYSPHASLRDLLNFALGYQKEPYQMLADAMGWDVEAVKWLKRKNGFYTNTLETEVNFTIELILKMRDMFAIANKFAVSPRQLYESVYQKAFEEPADLAAVADTLYQWLGLKHSPKDWELLSRELHDQVNLLKQSVLLPYVITHYFEYDLRLISLPSTASLSGQNGRRLVVLAKIREAYHVVSFNADGELVFGDDNSRLPADLLALGLQDQLEGIFQTATPGRPIRVDTPTKLAILRSLATLSPHIVQIEPLDNARDLFAKLLVDVNMGSEAKTSKVKEAISAIQLYLHRYFVNLESVDLKAPGDREDLKRWWTWMRNYRVWEANRKVFLYPENYIRPELRDTKSPIFKKLEEALMQGEITDELVTGAFYNYLEEFAKVGNLKITGANVHDEGDNQVLVLFGHTRTEPVQYYYQTSQFLKSGDVIWGNWLPVDISINSTRVFPIYAFGRILLFWIEIHAQEESVPYGRNQGTPAKRESATKVDTSDTVLKYRASVKYSFYGFNRQWVHPQTLQEGIELNYQVDAAYVAGKDSLVLFSGEYCLTTTPNNPQGDIKKIVEVYDFPPEFDQNLQNSVDAAFNYGSDWLVLFKKNKCAIGKFPANRNPKAITWDVKPIAEVFKDPDRKPLEAQNFYPQILWHHLDDQQNNDYTDGVAAAFHASSKDNTICLIDYNGAPVFFKISNDSTATNLIFEEAVVDLDKDNFWQAFFSILTRQFLRLEPVDAVFQEGDLIYMLRQGQYECYRYDETAIVPLQKLDGFPKSIKDNLGFNLDQFFNRLHVVEASYQTREFVNLTYINPKANSPLLNGRIGDDFEFISTEFVSSEKRQVWQALRTSLEIIDEGEIVKLTENFPQNEAATELNNFLGKARQLAILETRRQTLSNILSIIRSITTRKVGEEEQVVLPSNYNESMMLSELQAARDDAYNTNHPYYNLTLSSRKELDDLNKAFRAFAGAKTKANLDKIKTEKPSNGKTLLEEAEEAINGTGASGSNRLYLKPQDYRNAIAGLKQEYLILFNGASQRIASLSRVHQQNVQLLRSRFNRDFGDDRFTIDTSLAQHTGTRDDILTALQRLKATPRQQLTQLNQLSLPAFWLTRSAVNEATTAQEMVNDLNTVSANRSTFETNLTTIDNTLGTALTSLNGLYRSVGDLLDQLLELYFGKDDIFPAGFGIDNQSNFTFGQPDWHVFEAKKGTFLCRPLPDTEFTVTNQQYQILRLTTTRIPQLGKNLFAGGVDRLLTLEMQLEDETPNFQPQGNNGIPDQTITYARSFTVDVGQTQVSIRLDDRVPHATTLDFKSANSNYYWEIFFHAPYLIAQTLNAAQKFAEAKRWYEFIFDPTADMGAIRDGIADAHWRFLPFARIPEPLTSHLEDHLHRRLDIEDLAAEIEVYLNDPFDPHAIARIRQTAYQKAIVMAYIDNLTDWGDMLFRQYSQESINEARMLYVLAYDLLGEKPVALAEERLPAATPYAALINPSDTETDLLLNTEIAIAHGTPHETVESPYFYIPDNSLFLDYWNRVEDRLYKIRNSLNIDGVKQALPLFQPPIDPMALVQAVAGGASLSSIMAGARVPVPHYRFNFVFYKAKELVQRLNQFGGDLLSAIEKRDSEQLSLMQQKQEAAILAMLTHVKEAQIAEAQESIRALEASLAMVEANEAYNRATVKAEFNDAEKAQLALMSAAVAGHLVSVVARTIASFGGAAPDALIGPFIAGIKIGGEQAHSVASSIAEVSQTAAEGLSIGGEIAGIIAQHQRLMADLKHQVDTAIHDKQQIRAQIEGAKLQLKIAEYERAIHAKEIENNRSIATFMTDKFSNQQLYQWMMSQLSGLYYQAYKLAYDMAKAAETAFQYERGLPESEVNFISGMYWNSQRKGLLAGDSLGLDLDRMEQAFIQGDRRRFEISKPISLLALDPLAFLTLKATGKCEFELSEAFFDYDFPGHYCRQIKTLEVSFDAAEGQIVNATLTQLNHKTVLTADPKAVKYLLEPKGDQPLSIRNDWRAHQQIVLSHVDQYEKGHGLFERRFEDDRYLPFEGTGAVSRWRLELNGKRGAIDLTQLLDVNIMVKYTALPGGEAFADAVKGLLKPYDTVRFIDLNFDFHNEWLEFLSNEETALTLTFTPALFPNMAGSRITGLFSKFELQYDESVSLMLNNDDSLVLQDGQFLETPGLSVRPFGTDWTFTVQGDKAALKTVQLVVGYKAHV